MAQSTRDRLLADLRDRLSSGELALGGLMPSERDLAQRMGVARGTLRVVLSELEECGVLSREGIRRRVLSIPRISTGVMADTIGILVRNSEPSRSHQSGGWDDVVVTGAQQAIQELGLHGLSLYPEQLLRRGLDEFRANPPRGIIASSLLYRFPGHEQILEALLHDHIPLVLHGDRSELGHVRRIDSDHAQGNCELTKWLISQGRTRILRILQDEKTVPYWLERRTRGYELALRQAGIPPLEPLFHITMPESGDEACFNGKVMMLWGYLTNYLQTHGGFDAIMVASDRHFFQTAAACRKLGLEPGKDVLIVGYDNFWQECDERGWEPSIPAATVDKQNLRIGRALVGALMEEIEARNPRREELSLVSPKLVIPQ